MNQDQARKFAEAVATFELIEGAMPDGNPIFKDAYGNNSVSAKWLHAFVKKAIAAALVKFTRGQDPVAWPDAPDVIYLQVCAEDECSDSFHQHDEVTWCADMINDRDIKYVRASPQANHPQAAEQGEPETEHLCTNCLTPWKCNGPHEAEPKVEAMEKAEAALAAEQAKRGG